MVLAIVGAAIVLMTAYMFFFAGSNACACEHPPSESPPPTEQPEGRRYK